MPTKKFPELDTNLLLMATYLYLKWSQLHQFTIHVVLLFILATAHSGSSLDTWLARLTCETDAMER